MVSEIHTSIIYSDYRYSNVLAHRESHADIGDIVTTNW